MQRSHCACSVQQFSDGKSSLQTLLTAVLTAGQNRGAYHIKMYHHYHQLDVCQRRVCSRGGWLGIQLQVKEEGIMGRNDESGQDFTPWWTCAGPGRTHGCCSRTRCRTCRQTVSRGKCVIFMNGKVQHEGNVGCSFPVIPGLARSLCEGYMLKCATFRILFSNEKVCKCKEKWDLMKKWQLHRI